MLCYNIGCAKNFDPNENKSDSCQYHPKPPIFHDGRKGWECCNKFSTDFSTCLNMPGCQKGFHNNEKPKEQLKPKLDSKYDVELVVVEPPKPEPKKERSSDNEEMQALIISVLPSSRSSLEQFRSQKKADTTNVVNGFCDSVNYGTRCQNIGCTKMYTGGDSNKEICLYHSGEAIFHEGMKFWSCCTRKTSEFDNFLSQEGCTSGTHLWFKERKADCRFDWFQTGSSLTVTFYGKVPVPESMLVRANGVKLNIKFDFDGGSASYERDFTLFDVIEPDKCQVKVASTKVEVILKKRDISLWKYLELEKVTVNGDQS